MNKSHWLFLFMLTLIWFSFFTASYEIVCNGDPAGIAYGNFFIWNMPSAITSLGLIIDIPFLILDFILSFMLTVFILKLIKIVLKIPILELISKYRLVKTILVFLFILSCLFLFISLSMNPYFQSIPCDTILTSIKFNLR